MSEPTAMRTLRNLPRDKAFYFFTSIGNYTGESAASLEEFVKKILEVNVKSLEFHLYRGDFEKWIAETLEDNELANKLKQLKELKPIGIDLRDRLYLIASKYHENLKKPHKTFTTPAPTKPKPATITFGKPQPQKTVKAEAEEQ
ncbi:MAG: DUF5752 family protein [Candidatus Bathyarchaeia archaeon]